MQINVVLEIYYTARFQFSIFYTFQHEYVYTTLCYITLAV